MKSGDGRPRSVVVEVEGGPTDVTVGLSEGQGADRDGLVLPRTME